MSLPKPPKAYDQFVERFPHLGKAWDEIHTQGDATDLDEKTRRLIRIAASVGAGRMGAVRAGTRKARAMGIPRQEIEQVVALAAGTIGIPASVAAFCWMQDVFEAEQT